MANRFPLIVNSSTSQIQELPSADNLDLTGCGILNSSATITLPTSTGTLATLAGTETFTNKTLTSPTLTTPALGTPSSGTLTSCTGLPISTGVSGLGTSVATALAVAVGSAGALVTNGGALGTPSSGTLTNCTFPTLNQNTTGSAGSVANALTISTGLSGTSYNGSGAVTIALANTAVTAGSYTYASITVDAQGRLTAASNGTTPLVSGGALGTPSSATLTNATGLPISTGVSGLASGAATFLTTPTSANLFSLLTTDTGTGNVVFGTAPSLSNIFLTGAREFVTISATAANSSVAFDYSTQSVLYYTSNASANWSINIRGNSGTTLNSIMTTGDAITVAFIVPQGGTAYYNTSVQVDGTTSGVTTTWSGGAPTKGNASGQDHYTYTVIKTGNAAFTVFAALTQFKA